MHLIYSFIYCLALLFLFIPQYLKRPGDTRRRWLRNKLGIFDLKPCPQTTPVWVHAVSVGEVNAAITFIKRLRLKHPDLPLILSTMTDTGQKIAHERVTGNTSVVYLPFDLSMVLGRCLDKVRPKLLIVIETELWPNLFRAAAERNIPVIMLNGRISERSAKGYRKISFFMKRVLDYVTLFCMQGADDAERIRSVGADSGKVSVTGNFKFDMEIDPLLPDWLSRIKGRIIVAGSTHAGEEEMIIRAYSENLKFFPDLRLMIAPRHPERFEEAEEAVRRSGIKYLKYSDMQTEKLSEEHRIILIDTMGQLTAAYGIAEIAVIGKSFLGEGGQNPLEPAFWGKPIICGPHMENFPFIAEFYAEGAAFEATVDSLTKKIKELLMNPEKAGAAGSRAKDLFRKNSGAVQRAVNIVTDMLK